MRNALRRLALIPAVSLLAPILLAGCGETIGRTLDDPTITLRVEEALFNDPTISAVRIHVDTTTGVVTLSGDVKSRYEAERAVQLTRGVSGVKDVKSALKISKGGESRPEDRRLSAELSRIHPSVMSADLRARSSPHVSESGADCAWCARGGDRRVGAGLRFSPASSKLEGHLCSESSVH